MYERMWDSMLLSVHVFFRRFFDSLNILSWLLTIVLLGLLINLEVEGRVKKEYKEVLA